jgi:predicted Zn-dependent protease
MRAKLHGFLEPFAVTLRRYKESDHSLASRYARAIAQYRKPDLGKALPLIDGLIAQQPTDPYFHELKGQMLFENGRIDEALEPYETATRLLPHSAQLRAGLARIQLELNRPALLEPAIANLRAVLRKERDNSFLWRQLAIAYGRNGQMGQSALAMAEESMLKGDTSAAGYHATRAQETLPHGSAGWLKAEDVLSAVKQKKN